MKTSNEELENIEDELTQEELEKKKAKMLVSGKSVFEIQKMKRDRTQSIDKKQK